MKRAPRTDAPAGGPATLLKRLPPAVVIAALTAITPPLAASPAREQTAPFEVEVNSFGRMALGRAGSGLGVRANVSVPFTQDLRLFFGVEESLPGVRGTEARALSAGFGIPFAAGDWYQPRLRLHLLGFRLSGDEVGLGLVGLEGGVRLPIASWLGATASARLDSEFLSRPDGPGVEEGPDIAASLHVGATVMLPPSTPNR